MNEFLQFLVTCEKTKYFYVNAFCGWLWGTLCKRWCKLTLGPPEAIAVCAPLLDNKNILNNCRLTNRTKINTICKRIQTKVKVWVTNKNENLTWQYFIFFVYICFAHKRYLQSNLEYLQKYIWGLGTFGNPVGLLDKALSFEKSITSINNY
jgi:hypothetical protein